MKFYKYQGTGNDFIIVDSRNMDIRLTKNQIAGMCNRRFGIGADGFMLLNGHPRHNFKMVYYNADGKESTMCGNGGRCITAFAQSLNIIINEASFLAVDGVHTATIDERGIISLQMNNVSNIETYTTHYILNTGSPHYVMRVADLRNFNVTDEGKKIRNSPQFIAEGINVNFVQIVNDRLYVRTYERGVEAETLSCGTGVVAAAIAVTEDLIGRFNTVIETNGGLLEVSFVKPNPFTAKNIILKGPATFVFQGDIHLH